MTAGMPLLGLQGKLKSLKGKLEAFQRREFQIFEITQEALLRPLPFLLRPGVSTLPSGGGLHSHFSSGMAV
jgi:hypothetical protein